MAVGAELPALIGVVVGAVASYATSALGERARWKRNISSRWDERRLAAYVDYIRAVKGLVRTASRMAAQRGLDRQSYPMDLQAGEPLLQDAESERAKAYETLVLLGDSATISAAQKLQRQVWRLEWMALGRTVADDTDWEQAFGEYKEARSAFYATTRRDLGVVGETVPRGEWPPAWQQPGSARPPGAE